MASVGRLLPFDETSKDIEAYFELVDMFFAANNVVIASQQVASLITVLGPHAYDELRTACHPELPKDKSIKDIKKILIERFKRPNLHLSERLRLSNRRQQAGETVAQFAQALRRLARSCGYTGQSGAVQQSAALLESFVNNIRDVRVKKEVIAKDNLNLKKAEEIAAKYELVYEQLDKIEEQQDNGQTPVVAALSSLEDSVCAMTLSHCWRCGSKGHNSDVFRAKTWECFVCGNIGHIATMCSERREQGQVTSERQRKEWSERPQTQRLQQSRDGASHCRCCRGQYEQHDVARGGSERGGFSSVPEPDREYARGARSQPARGESSYQRGVEQGRAESSYQRGVEQGRAQRQRSTEMSKGFTNKKCMCFEDDDVNSDSSDGRMYEKLPLYVTLVESRRPPLLGCDWLTEVKINWSQFKKERNDYLGELGSCKSECTFDEAAHSEIIDVIKHEFPMLLGKDVGCIKQYEANIVLKENASPVFRKAYSVPVALKPAVEKELDNQVAQGILYPVKFSQWATPIVVVEKKNSDEVRLFGDFKRTLNPMTEPEHYPLPTFDEMSMNWAAYLKGAYLQIVRGIPGCCAYLDDVCVAGRTREEARDRIAGTVTPRPRVELGSPRQAFGTPEKPRTLNLVDPVPEPAHSPVE
ncbi:hypothetical protein B566_EDAN014526 [Ephemera danica]|nr:hypothetical protein B566_EDAN014526 [Ephemera danica]